MRLKDVLHKHPEIKKSPIFSRFPNAFEDALLMVAKKNGLNPERTNLENIYSYDGVIKNAKGDVLFYYDCEYSTVKDLFDGNGKINFWTVSIPLEKRRYFEEHKPSFYVRGSWDLRWVLVLRGDAILTHSKTTTKLCNHDGIKEMRDFMEVHTHSMIKNGCLKTGKLQDWLKLVKKLYPLLIF
ncbi:MAG: hypothetical protein AB1420_15925 [Bacillota bacterium]